MDQRPVLAGQNVRANLEAFGRVRGPEGVSGPNLGKRVEAFFYLFVEVVANVEGAEVGLWGVSAVRSSPIWESGETKILRWGSMSDKCCLGWPGPACDCFYPRVAKPDAGLELAGGLWT